MISPEKTTSGIIFIYYIYKYYESNIHNGFYAFCRLREGPGCYRF